MGMRIQGGGSASSAQSMQNTQWQQRKQSFDALAQAITGGDLAAANAALSKITAQMPQGASSNPDGFMSKIGSALSSGDITGAQQILASRFSRRGSDGDSNGTATAGATPSVSTSDPVAATAATAATGATSSIGQASPYQGHRGHHRHAQEGASGPVTDLSAAIQSGDTSTAQTAMQKIIQDLQQLSDLGSNATSISGAASLSPGTNSSMLSSAISSANSLINNPDFQSLETAVAGGDASTIKSAWTKFLSGASASTSANTTTAAAITPAVDPAATSSDASTTI